MTANVFAGMGSHQSARSKTDTWFTPPEIIEALGGYDSFDLDPCSPITRPFPTARQHYSEADNGLLLPWTGRVWLNPPYTVALLKKFMGRMVDHGTGTALIFARTETDAFHRFVWQAADAVLFLRGRLNFLQVNGMVAERNAGAPSVLIAYGENDCEILSEAAIDGVFVPLVFRRHWLMEMPARSWRAILKDVFAERPEPLRLEEIYRALRSHPKCRTNRNWQAKVRQTLQLGDYRRVGRGVWEPAHV